MNKNIKLRAVALEILEQVIYKKEYSNKLLSEIDKNYLLMEKDKNLVFKIVYGTLQNKIFLDFVISKFTNSKKTNNKLLLLLELSFYQIYFLDRIPPYAVINEAVNISKKISPSSSGFINATLKNLLKLTDIDAFLDKYNLSSHRKLLIKYSMPDWIYDILKFKFDNKDIIEFIKNNTNRPKLSYRVNSNKIDYEKFNSLFGKRFNFVKSIITKNGIISKDPLIKTSFFNEGMIISQDEMSQLVVEVLDPRPGEMILDMCSAPGGKTTYISELMHNRGFIDALEIDKNKIEIINDNIKKMSSKNITVYNIDALKYKSPLSYDKILLDPSCSGIGVIKRKPEIKYRNINKLSISHLITNQFKLLKKAYEFLKPGGIIVYSTCTINYKENGMQVIKFIKQFPDMSLIFEKQFFGYEDNTDGFYYSLIYKLKNIEKNK